MKLKHIEDAGGGRLRYRRRFSKAVAGETEKAFFKASLGALEGAALALAWSKADAAYAAAVLASQKRLAVAARRGPLEQAEDIKRQVAELLAGVSAAPEVDDEGSELVSAEDAARHLLAEHLLESGADPRLYSAAVLPEAPPPPPTLRDAVNLYVREKLADGDGFAENRDVQRVERVFARIAKALGPLDKLALADLRNQHGKKAVEQYLAERTKTGGLLAVESIRRELNIAKAVVNYAILGFDLEKTAKNPFAKLPVVRRGEAAPVSDGDKRHSLPEAVISSLSAGLRADDLRSIWRLLAGTGCRLAEVTGLTLEDIDLAANIPHIRVRWNENRRLKTVVSIRSVPLVGDALEAAREALALPRTGKAVFPRYGREGGATAASQVLMNHLRKQTKDPKHVVHSLRHNMRARLERAKVEGEGVPEVVINLILGHSLGSVGARVYGDDRLPLTAGALEAAQKVIL